MDAISELLADESKKAEMQSALSDAAKAAAEVRLEGLAHTCSRL